MSSGPAAETQQELLQLVDARLRLVTTAIDGLDQRAARRLGVNRTDLRLLDLLAVRGPQTLAQLGQSLGISSGGMTVAIDRLSKSGYVTRRPHATDRRSQVVGLTPQLWRRAEPIFGALQQGVRRLLLEYSPAQLEQLSQFLLAWEQAIAAAGSTPQRG